MASAKCKVPGMTLHVGAEQGWGDWKNSQTLGCLLNDFRNFVEKEIRTMEMASGRNRANTDVTVTTAHIHSKYVY